MTITCPLSVLYKSQKDRIKDSIIKRVKVKKCRKYGIKSILRQVRKSEKFNSIPVRVTIQCSRKQRKYVVSEFFFYTENRVCPLLVRYSDHVADILVLSCRIITRQETERSVHCLRHSRLCGLEHMSIDVQSRS